MLTLAALPLAACGFKPVYQAGGAARQLQGQIHFNLIQSREGFALLERLESRFGPGSEKSRFMAKLDLQISQDDLLLDATNGISRFTLNGKVLLTLSDRTKNSVILTETFRDVAGYSGTSETAETVAARSDAYNRLVDALADQIILRLTSTAEGWAV